MEPKLIRNRIRCKTCDDIIESKYGHDFKYCKCGKVFVDGGLEYCRYGYPGGDVDDWIEMLSEYGEAPDKPKKPDPKDSLRELRLLAEAAEHYTKISKEQRRDCIPEPAVSHYGLLLDKSDESGIIGGKL